MLLIWQQDFWKASSPFPFSLQISGWGLQCRGDTNMGKPVLCMAKSLEASRLLLSALRACVCYQSCPTLSDPMDCGLPDSSVYGIFWERILEWVAISYSGDLPDPGINPCLLH